MGSPSTKEQQTFVFADGQSLLITWQRSRRNRNIRLTISNHQFRVSSPPRISWTQIQQFLKKQEAWIRTHFDNQQTQKNNQLLLFQGKELSLKLQPHLTTRVSVHLNDNEPHVLVSPIEWSAASTKKTLERWLKTQAADQLTPLLTQCQEQMQLFSTKLRWRDTHSRWGSCSTDGTVMLSWRLIHAPIPVARYVIVHELAHLVHHNHSRAFWQLVEKFDPDYRVHRGWLKRHGQQCQTPPVKLPQH